MAYIIYSTVHQRPLVCVDGVPHSAHPAEGEIVIPCEPGADVNNIERWEQEAADSLNVAKAMKRIELTQTRDEIVAQGFVWDGHVFPLSADVQVSLMQQFMGSQLLPAPSYAWKDMDGIYREIGDAAAFQMFCAAAMMYGKSLFDWEEMLQILVNQAETVEAVESITWETVPEESI